jgi:hypothetical protein
LTDNVGMTKPVQMIVVDSDGEILTAANGQLSGEYARIQSIKRNLLLADPVEMFAPYGDAVVPELDVQNPIAIVAALFSAAPGRTSLLDAPGEVWDWFHDHMREDDEEDVTDEDDDLPLTIQP